MNNGERDWQNFRCRTQIEIRFRDLDALGHVNNAVYFTYFEIAPMAYLRALAGKPVTLDQLRIIVVNAACRYHSPALLGETLEIGIRVSHLRRSSFAFDYLLRCADADRLVAAGRTIQATFDHQQQRIVPLGPDFRAQVERYENRSFNPQSPFPPWDT